MKRVPYVVLMLALASGACAKKQPPAAPAPESTPQTVTTASNNDDAERLRREEEERRRRAEAERKMAMLSERIFFAYDRSDISSEAAATLQAKLPLLREDAAISLRIEGHADERGSLEYNLALGLRRAQAVRDYLAGFGIDGSRLAIESFGEDRPLDSGSNEQAWSRNRRAEFLANAR
jgi:peptidoglycan-associated lipoprotein